MKGWQILLLSFMGTFVLGLVVSLAVCVGYFANPYFTPPPTPQVVQVPVQVPAPEIPIEKIVSEIVKQVLQSLPTPAPQQVSIVQPVVVDTLPTPVPEVVQEVAVDCIDAANIVVNTPYFKTWKPTVTASVTVYNLGTCIWDEYYLSPTQTLIPYTMPGGYAELTFELPTQKGLTQTVLEVRTVKGEPVTMNLPPSDVQFDYANPTATIPQGVIVINFPTQDWEGIKIDWPKQTSAGGYNWYCFGGT